MAVTIRVLCWDHPRCTGPMAAAAAAYQVRRPGVDVRLGSRPLAMFNDQPPWEVDDGYDLIVVDHPMIGGIAERGTLVPLDTVLPAGVLTEIEHGAVGASYASYTWDGHQWALPGDAACHVSVAHQDRLALGATMPRSWADVLALARTAPGSVALPLYPSDAICSLLSLSANAAAAAGIGARANGSPLVAEAAEFLAELARLVDPVCFDLNPPRLLDAMLAGGPIAYVPLTFGYSTLARPPLRFADVPGVDGRPRGAVLGGAGLGVLASSPYITEAAEFAAWYCGPGVQREVVLVADGQPGHRKVWDEAADGTFFAATRQSMRHAYLRPRWPWWPAYQRAAGETLADLLRDGAAADRIMRELAALETAHRAAQPTEAEERA